MFLRLFHHSRNAIPGTSDFFFIFIFFIHCFLKHVPAVFFVSRGRVIRVPACMVGWTLELYRTTMFRTSVCVYRSTGRKVGRKPPRSCRHRRCGGGGGANFIGRFNRHGMQVVGPMIEQQLHIPLNSLCGATTALLYRKSMHSQSPCQRRDEAFTINCSYLLTSSAFICSLLRLRRLVLHTVNDIIPTTTWVFWV